MAGDLSCARAVAALGYCALALLAVSSGAQSAAFAALLAHAGQAVDPTLMRWHLCAKLERPDCAITSLRDWTAPHRAAVHASSASDELATRNYTLRLRVPLLVQSIVTKEKAR